MEDEISFGVSPAAHLHPSALLKFKKEGLPEDRLIKCILLWDFLRQSWNCWSASTCRHRRAFIHECYRGASEMYCA